MASDKISQTTVIKAVNALLKWRKLHPSKSTATKEDDEFIFDEEEKDTAEDFVYLLLTLKKVPPKDILVSIPLPNPLHSPDNLNLCLIIDDRPIKSPYRITSEFAQKKIKSEDIPISKVLKLSKLRSKFCKSFEGRRNLYDSYDLFLADKRVVPLLPNLLGKQFYKKNRKVPVALDLSGRCDWKEQIERACHSASLCFGSGTSCGLRVGRCGSQSKVIVENICAAIRGILELVPNKWGGIRALHLKLSDSLALPIYDAASPEEGGLVDKKMNKGRAVWT